MSNLAQNETYKELRAQRDTARDRLAHLRNLVQNVIGAERRRADLAEQHANDAIAHAEDMQRSRDACRTALANQIQQLATCQAALAIAQGAAAPGGIPPAAGGTRKTTRRRRRRAAAQKGGSHDGPEMQARFSDRERRACLDQLDRTRARLIRANNRIAALRAAVATGNQNIATLQARYDECEAHRDAQRQTLRVWAQRIGELQKQKRLLGIRLLRFREAGDGGGGGGSAGALNGGGRRTRRRNRRRKRHQRKTRRGGDSPLHIRRRLLALAARIKKWKNERQRHKDAKAKEEAEKKASSFGAIPEGIN